jgi:pimeloyl-ACP methyl ester carboxylesterase
VKPRTVGKPDIFTPLHTRLAVAEQEDPVNSPVVILAALSVTILPARGNVPAAGEQSMNTAASTGRARVNGVELYYEVHGEGAPLVLLHGGVNPSEMLGAPLTEMAKTHKVIAPHLQGHGLSKDSDRPWSYENSADDVAALLAHLGIQKASVMGYSYGAAVALQTTIRHPELINKLVVISAAFRSDGNYPEISQAFAQMPAAASAIAEKVRKSPLATMYPAVDWETMFRKTGELNGRQYDWSAGVAGIKAPTLLIFADADAIRTDHIVEFYKLLGGGQRDAGLDGSLRTSNRLAIIPNTTHYNILGASAVTRFATEFLESR